MMMSCSGSSPHLLSLRLTVVVGDYASFSVYRNVPGQSAMTFTQENDGMLVKELLDKVLVERLAPLKRGYYFSKKLYKASSN